MTGGGSETAGAAGDRPRARARRSGSVSDELPWRVRATRAAPAQQRWGCRGGRLGCTGTVQWVPSGGGRIKNNTMSDQTLPSCKRSFPHYEDLVSRREAPSRTWRRSQRLAELFHRSDEETEAQGRAAIKDRGWGKGPGAGQELYSAGTGSVT